MGCSSFIAFFQPVAAQKLVVGDTIAIISPSSAILSFSQSLNFSFSQFLILSISHSLILSSNNWDSFLIISESNPNFY
jgi:hypothetical protein